ncbi:TetR/AcrR family transcriptional regulator C-terminal domain-containing protein [Actinoplanes regularis]|uniref:Transcriptional regulator, TetR family n=1 Tax=Actinoplanes regularis TaxID=52697 RepID=A0A238UQH3_9ACTN|nr:TetR/AcrR family transcriptional regulator C-terminal domain-containing protein [Actinoplanes regularis]GIE84562.1 GntR family transcriptional regulator [Actinoplanes regularis]GLW32724.1 GntR family transcriptional regulator [Actinoplanes regularis]SNR24181.1 transcriptional regulator, TetR family [Actinoplanes regularis]
MEAAYTRIVAELRRRIEAGELRPGDRVPSARAITREWGVAIATATKAHAALRDEGLTVARPGVGTVVAGPAPRRDTDLGLERIVAAAIVIADRDGMAELSMRRIATDLGVATMSLYRHVPSRDELEVAMIDAALGELRVPPRYSGDWRADLERCGRAMWELFQRHPWLGVTMSLTRPQLSVNGMRLGEWVMGTLAPTRLGVTDRMLVQILLFSFIRGVAGALQPEAEAMRDTGLTGDEWMETQEATFHRFVERHPMPSYEELFLRTPDFDFDLNVLFEFGLARLLDGIGAWIERAA